MTNKNRKHEIKQGAEKKVNFQYDKIERKGKMMFGYIIPIIISIMSLIVSIISIGASGYFAIKEYQYKLDPEVTANTEIGVMAYQTDDSMKSFDVYSDGITIHILAKNNLSKAYLIYPDFTGKEMAVNDVEHILEQELDSGFKVGEYDLQTGEAAYQYRFVALKGLDGSYNLTLIYTKWDGEEFVFDGVSDMEVWGMANSNVIDPLYEGEKIMAKEYRMILQKIVNYMI